MNPVITAADVNAVFRGEVYGERDMFSDESFAQFVRTNDIDLQLSMKVLQHDALIGLALLARRGERAWIGGYGVAPAFRRAGHGRAVFERTLQRARDAGIATVELEVMHRNERAAQLYRHFEFETIDELLVWSREPKPHAANDLAFESRSEADVTSAARTPAACWQREARSVAAAGESALVQRDGAYAFVRVRGDRALLLDAAAPNESAAQGLLDELDRRVPFALTLLNEPQDSALSRALLDAEWRITERQHRMKLRL